MIKKSFKKIIHFVKYHNGFTIGLFVLLVLGGAVFASEDMRDAVFGEAVVEVSGIDNTAFLAADLDMLDHSITINNIAEDNENYYITYSLQTFAIINNAWQLATSTQELKITKVALGSKDLGLYLAEELSEVGQSQLAYLKEAQNIEKSKGATHIIETTKYTALIGLALNPVSRELPGYQPIIEPSAAEPFVPIAGVEIEQPLSLSTLGVDSAHDDTEGAPQNDGPAGQSLPNTIIAVHPAASISVSATSSADALFVFNAIADSTILENATFQCKINQQDWQDCQSPKRYVNLTAGEYNFQVFAINEIGQSDPSPASFSWTVLESLSTPSVDNATSTPPNIATSTSPQTATTTPIVSNQLLIIEPATSTESNSHPEGNPEGSQSSTTTEPTATTTPEQ